MADKENEPSSTGNKEELSDGQSSDYSQEFEEDDEATLEEEETADDGGDANELNDLQDEAEMPIELLLARYGGAAVPLADMPTSSSVDDTVPTKRRRRVANESNEASADGPETSIVNEASAADIVPSSTTSDSVLENTTEASFNREYEGDEDDSNSAQNALQYLANGELPGDTGFDDEENDADYVPAAKIEHHARVGDEYNIDPDTLPLVRELALAQSDKHQANTMWQPNNNMSERDVILFLATIATDVKCGGSPPLRVSDACTLASSINAAECDEEKLKLLRREAAERGTLNGIPVPDNDAALFLCMKCEYNAEEAVQRYQKFVERVNETKKKNQEEIRLAHRKEEQGTGEMVAVNGNGVHESNESDKSPLAEESRVRCAMNVDERVEHCVPIHRRWLDDEITVFEHALSQFNKNFAAIQQALPHRSYAEIVYFYYQWKKTERAEVFARRTNRLEKRQYTCNPDTTDHMEMFVNEATHHHYQYGHQPVHYDSHGHISLMHHANVPTSLTSTDALPATEGTLLHTPSLSGAYKSPPYTTLVAVAQQFSESVQATGDNALTQAANAAALPTLEPHCVDQLLQHTDER